MKRLILAAIAAVFFLAQPAAAQQPAAATPQPTTPVIGQVGVTPVGAPTYLIQEKPDAATGGIVSLGPIFGNPQVDQAAQDIVNSLVLGAMGWIFWVIKNKLGVSIDKDQRDALTAAAQRQASSLVADGMVSLSGKGIKVDDKALAQAAYALQRAAPDALKHFGITDPQHLADRIVDLVPQVPAVAPAIAAAHTNNSSDGSVPPLQPEKST